MAPARWRNWRIVAVGNTRSAQVCVGVEALRQGAQLGAGLVAGGGQQSRPVGGATWFGAG